MDNTKEELIRLINEANPTSPQLSNRDITFSDPVESIGVNYNTKITVKSIHGSGYVGDVDVFYKRININLNDIEFEVISETPYSLEDLLGLINKYQKTTLTNNDITVDQFPTLSFGSLNTILMRANQKSLYWNGEISVSVLTGLSPNVDLLHTLVNFKFPSNNYLE